MLIISNCNTLYMYTYICTRDQYKCNNISIKHIWYVCSEKRCLSICFVTPNRALKRHTTIRRTIFVYACLNAKRSFCPTWYKKKAITRNSGLQGLILDNILTIHELPDNYNQTSEAFHYCYLNLIDMRTKQVIEITCCEVY